VTADIHHNAAELFDLRFLHAGRNCAVCCECGDIIELGDPNLVGSLFAVVHRLLCGPTEIL
jgi:hypothetical protein